MKMTKMSSLRFQNLGDPPFRQELVKIAKVELLSALPEAEFCNEVSIQKLYKPESLPSELAGIGIYIPALIKASDLEMVQVFTVKAKAFEWTFARDWCYWVCYTETRPLPMEEAQKLNETWGSQARVDGHAGGKDVQGDVGLYHVDTWVGLAVLVAGIRYQALMSAPPVRSSDYERAVTEELCNWDEMVRLRETDSREEGADYVVRLKK